MSIQHLNDVNSIARVAKATGATLPEHIATALDHLHTLATEENNRPDSPAKVAADLAQHLGDPAALNKARKAATQRLLAAELDAKIGAHLHTAAASRLRQIMRRDGDEVAAAIGDALADDIATLNAEAPKLPALFRPEHADRLGSSGFAAWTRARDAYDRIKATQTALEVLYRGALSFDQVGQFPTAAAASLRFAVPPTFTTPTAAYAFRDALAGRAQGGQGTASQGVASIGGLFVPTVLAHVGATFEWATPTQVTERASRVVNAMIPPVVHRDDARSAVA